MPQKTFQLEASLLVKDDCEHCLDELQRVLSTRNGIEKVHLSGDKIFLHFDPNLVSVSSLERMARELGGELESRFRHERFRLLSQHSGDLAPGLEQQLKEHEGIFHANVNTAASSISVAFDATLITVDDVLKLLARSGLSAEVIQPVCCGGHHKHEAHHHHAHEPSHHDHAECSGQHHDDHHHHAGCSHGEAPSFLPDWLRQRWQILLVVLCGVFYLTGFLGHRFFSLSEQTSWLLYVLAYAAGAYDISTHAIPGLFKGRFNTDILMLAAAAGAAALGEWAEGAFLLFLFSLGHAGEHYALEKARNAIDALGELMPSKANIKTDSGVEEVPLDQVELGQVAVVRPGDRIPVDGTVVSGRSFVDQAPITGESQPVLKEPGDEVFCGTINQETALEIKVEKLAADSTLSRVMQMVSEAQDQKSPTQDFTQKFTSKFVPSVLLFTLLLIMVPPAMEWMTWRDSFYRAMLLLVASSPCALALGTPAAVLAGIAQAARNGVLIKGGLHLETLGSIRAIAFDKTGTLTEGRFKVTDLVGTGEVSEEELLTVAASIEQQSNHPIARAVVEAARGRELPLFQGESLENLAGFGVRSSHQGQSIWLGSRKLFSSGQGAPVLDGEFEQTVESFEKEGKTVVVVGRGESVLGVLTLTDTPRSSSKEALQKLQALGIQHTVMLTGDNKKAAENVGSQLGLTDIRAELLPDHKWEAVKELKEKFGALAMVGDGVNDAPALAAADVGIAMGGAGTAVALETADVALMGDDIARLPFAVGLSRASRRIIKQNLFISLGVIGVLILTSVTGLGDLSVTVAFHEGSTLAVIANALRLLAYKGQGSPNHTLK